MTEQSTNASREGATATEQNPAPRWENDHQAESGKRDPSKMEVRGSAVAIRAGGPPQAHARLHTERGSTRIADSVVAKIAGLATREIPGVQEMGKGFARTFGALRQKVTGAADEDMATQGVTVEVGERQAAIDLDIVTYYGQSIVEVTETVRENVIERVEAMTGLEVKEVNITVDDLYVDIEGEPQARAARVQ